VVVWHLPRPTGDRRGHAAKAPRTTPCVATYYVVKQRHGIDDSTRPAPGQRSAAAHPHEPGDRPKHGHALAKDIEDFAGVTLGPGALYGAITRLEERGLIEPLGAQDRRRPYRITTSGTAALAAAVADLRRIADVGSARLGFAGGQLA